MFGVLSKARRSSVLSFALWLLVGGLYGLGMITIFSIGSVVLIVAMVSTIRLARTDFPKNCLFGLLSGFGLPLLYMAFINRNGPGTECYTSGGVYTCTGESSPWPWFVLGLSMILVGFAASITFSKRYRKSGSDHSIAH
jgi:hypothetical protein